MMFFLLFFLSITISLQSLYAERITNSCDDDAEIPYTGFCQVNGCITCDEVKAVCKTLNPQQVVPAGLDPRITNLQLTYTGPDTELSPDMFANLLSLTDLTISGNISSVAPNTFVKLWDLTKLSIFDSKLRSLPSELFSSSKNITSVNLSNNKFRQIPTNIFPQIPNVVHLLLHGNELEGCVNVTISPEFATLTHLYQLRLAKYGSSVELCQNVSKDYLVPIQHVKTLDLSESLLFHGDQRILTPLTSLTTLAINNVAPYRECPANAEELFHNMPQKLKNLTFRYWASTDRVNESCVLTDVVLAGLKKLKLGTFDCQYGDKLFGNVLKSSIFTGFSQLQDIFLNWCGFSYTEDGVFNGVPDLFNIDLTGNLLGPRDLKLYTGQIPNSLVVLHLTSTGMNIPTYEASSLLQTFSNLAVLNLDDNSFEHIPDFGTTTSELIVLTLNDNKITHFSNSEGEKLCKVLYSLATFAAAKNKLVDVSGFSSCSSITQILLSDNLIGMNLDQNFKAIGQVTELIVLDLSSNQIKYITPEFFANLSHLDTLILADNEIYSLADNIFDSNLLIKCLDLSTNDLRAFKESIISKGFLKLRSLYLQSNQITTLSPELLNRFDTQLTELKFLNLRKNPLACTCDSYLSSWVRQSPVVIQAKNLTCNTPTNPDITTQVVSYEPNNYYCNIRIPLMISGIVLACVVLSLLCALPGYKYRWYLIHPKVVARAIVEKLNEVEFEEKCQYDAFISYDTRSDSDSQWIVDKLIPAIEACSNEETATTSRKKLYVVDRDADIGSPKYTEKCRAIDASRKVIILLSNSYLGNPSCLSEADLVAGYEMVDGQHCYQPNRILVLVLEELNEEAIKSPVASLLTQNVIHIADRDEAKMKRIWRRVRRFLTRSMYVYRQKKRRATVPERVPTETDPLIQ